MSISFSTPRSGRSDVVHSIGCSRRASDRTSIYSTRLREPFLSIRRPAKSQRSTRERSPEDQRLEESWICASCSEGRSVSEFAVWKEGRSSLSIRVSCFSSSKLTQRNTIQGQEPSAPPAAQPFTSSAETSILPIITSQRDRFRQRNGELEEVSLRLSYRKTCPVAHRLVD